MATIVGIEVDGGAAIAGDRLLTEGGTVQSGSKQHVFDLGEVGAAAVGDSGGVDATGGVTTDAVIAKGSGAQFTLGVLEGTDRSLSLDSAEDLLRDAIDTAADRDTATGEDVDVYSIDNDGGRLKD
ncbi:hypothetical protein BRD15_09415 [Halobacteriales archaeon SW_6_65_15]|nr:MAG: hypothetical protein BRD15_09415 [Halobacteriales archaeon SW_6_65_15]